MASTPTSLNRLGDFLPRFRQFKLTQSRERLRRLSGSFIRLRPVLKKLRSQEAKRNAQVAPHFNIFAILGLERSEVRLHSAFLGRLLDPRAEHGQGVRLLFEFLKMAEGRGLKLPRTLGPTGWWIETERFAGKYGRLDVVIEHQQSGFLLAIENKIDAGLRPNQLEDYRCWLDAQHSRQPALRQLIFLTPDGHPGSVENVRLSYRRDIVTWLDLIMRYSPPRLRETILQYQQVVAALIEEDHDELA